MKGKKKHASEPEVSARATLTSLPKEIVEKIVDNLIGNDKVNLALCCKGMLPMLCMGTVRVKLDKPDSERPLTQLSRCLAKQPNGVLHLKLFTNAGLRGTDELIDLSLLSNLRELSLDTVSLSLPALQPIATRLQTLRMLGCRLRGSPDGFLSASWSALKLLHVRYSRVEHSTLATLNLPALESLDVGFLCIGNLGKMLQLDQLRCPQLSSLAFDLCSNKARASEASRLWCSLVHLAQVADLTLSHESFRAVLGLDLPASLKHLTLQGTCLGSSVDLKWALLEAGKGIRSGAHLCSLTCAHASPSSHPEGVPWGASSTAHYRELGEKLRGLTDLFVSGRATTLLSAISAVACSAPDLTCLTFCVEEELDDLVLPPVCSASLKSITGRFKVIGHKGPLAVVLTFLPGCTEVCEVHVQFYNNLPREGTSVKVCCHCTSQKCIMPLDVGAGLEEVGIRFLPVPPASEGLQAYTFIYTCHAAGPQQSLKWGYAVLPGVL